MKFRIVKILSIIILFVLALVGIYYFYTAHNSVLEKDNVKFAKEYTGVTEDNVFVYKNENEIVSILKSKSGIVYLGFPECPWCQKYVTLLNEVAKEKGIDEIYYFNIKDARANKTVAYTEIVEILNEYIPTDDEGNKKVMVPDLTFVMDGKVKWHNNDTSTISGMKIEDYWTAEKEAEFKQELGQAIDSVFHGVCTSCNE